MAVLPIGFFMPLPLPIMIPFMMWQSAAIATGFGTMFQYSKRRISAMSNEEFARANPTDLINADLDTFIAQMPSSFARVSAVNIMILDSMAKFLDDGAVWLGNRIRGGIALLTDPLTGNLSPGDISGLPEAGGELSSPPTDTTLPSDVTPIPDSSVRIDKFTGISYQHPRPMSLLIVRSFSDTELILARNRALDGQYTTSGKQIVLDEHALRNLEEGPVQPTIEQQTSNLTPAFIASLTQSDMKTGGIRSRMTANGLIQWNVPRQVVFTSAKTMYHNIWNGSRYEQRGASFPNQTLTQVDAFVNKLKTDLGASYVLVFGTTTLEYYIILDV